MLKALILENFKAFGGRRVIPIRPITLIFGPNSAGKSAILQSLLFLKQSVARSGEENNAFLAKGDLVDLGNFREMVFQNDTSRFCEITPVVSDSIHNYDDMASDWALGVMGEGSTGAKGVGARFTSIDNTHTCLYVESPLYVADLSEQIASFTRSAESHEKAAELLKAEASEISWSNLQLIDALWEMVEFKANNQHDWWSRAFESFDLHGRNRVTELLADRTALARHLDEYRTSASSRTEPTPGLIDELERVSLMNKDAFIDYFQTLANDEQASRKLFLLLETPWWAGSGRHAISLSERDVRMQAFQFLADFIHGADILFQGLPSVAQETSRQIRDMLSGLQYLGPLREFPLRHYEYSGLAASNVGLEGQFAADLLYSKPGLLRSVNQTLARFQIPYQLEIQSLTDEQNTVSGVYLLRLRDARSGIAASLRDVGFGISQLLPVIVQSLLLDDEILLIEQPELHLHPRLQAELADMFIQKACADSPRSTQFLIETHSEHLLLRVMRRLRDTSRGTLPDDVPEIHPEDVSIIYVHPLEDGSGSVPLVMDLDEDGELLTAWPNGFFEEGFRERFA